MVVATQIEINATPEEVRDIFLDFAKLSEWHTNPKRLIRSIAPVSSTSKQIQKGDKLRVDFSGSVTDVVVLENSPTEFSWRGDMMYVFSGEHSFRFEPSKTTPNGTTFLNSEEPYRLMYLLGPLIKETTISSFDELNRDLKARAESLKAST